MLVDVDGPPPSLVELLRRRVVSYSIALWSSVAAFTSWDWPWDIHFYHYLWSCFCFWFYCSWIWISPM